MNRGKAEAEGKIRYWLKCQSNGRKLKKQMDLLLAEKNRLKNAGFPYNKRVHNTLLRGKQVLSDLEKDILHTWNELQENPFDRSSAELQVQEINLRYPRYPEIFAAIRALATTVVRPLDQITESDIRYNLQKQLEALAAKEVYSCGVRPQKYDP